MATSRLLQLLHRLGWEFWLPLPLIAALFWVAGHSIAGQVLSRPYQSVNTLQADTQLNVKLSVAILSMNATIDRNQGVTTIFIKTTDSTLKKLEYEFPVTQLDQIEAAIAQELTIPVTEVRRLISYHIKE